MQPRTTYTAGQKNEALRLLAEVGKAEAARRTGIPAGTIASWGTRNGVTAPSAEQTEVATAAAAATATQRRTTLARGLLDDVEKLRGQLFARHVERKPLVVSDGAKEGSHVEIAEVELDRPAPSDQKAIMVAIAVAIDKVQLLLGDVTTRLGLATPVAEPEAPPEPAEQRSRALAVVHELTARRPA